ncbi:MAG: hypothetical protein HPY46_06720 [Candidatus Aminicenantes bacterium]|nr:hypothetical protein [Candidatus Aminicenantes bacterium]
MKPHLFSEYNDVCDITFLKNIIALIDSRSTRHSNRAVYYIIHSVIALILGIGFFAVLFVESKNRQHFQITIEIMLLFVLYILIISNLARYISHAEIRLWKINHFPIKKRDIYLSYLFSDLLSFRNIPSLTAIFIITAFLIKIYGLFAVFSLLFLMVYFFSIIVWIRNGLFILERFLVKKSIRENLYSVLLATVIIVFALSYILDKLDTEGIILSIFGYMPMGWAGNGIFGLQERLYIQALLNLAWLCIFSFVGIKVGLILVKRLSYA